LTLQKNRFHEPAERLFRNGALQQRLKPQLILFGDSARLKVAPFESGRSVGFSAVSKQMIKGNGAEVWHHQKSNATRILSVC
jgi:hypothetical protein